MRNLRDWALSKDMNEGDIFEMLECFEVDYIQRLKQVKTQVLHSIKSYEDPRETALVRSRCNQAVVSYFDSVLL